MKAKIDKCDICKTISITVETTGLCSNCLREHTINAPPKPLPQPMVAGCKHCDALDHLSERCKYKKKVYPLKRCVQCRRSFMPENPWQHRTSCCQRTGCLEPQKRLEKILGISNTTMAIKRQCLRCLEPKHTCRC